MRDYVNKQRTYESKRDKSTPLGVFLYNFLLRLVGVGLKVLRSAFVQDFHLKMYIPFIYISRNISIQIFNDVWNMICI